MKPICRYVCQYKFVPIFQYNLAPLWSCYYKPQKALLRPKTVLLSQCCIWYWLPSLTKWVMDPDCTSHHTHLVIMGDVDCLIGGCPKHACLTY